jgi:hypothetical protein
MHLPFGADTHTLLQTHHTHPLCVTGQHILLGVYNLGCLLLYSFDHMWVAVAC